MNALEDQIDKGGEIQTSGSVEIQSEGRYLAICIDSDEDLNGLDGRSDIAFLAGTPDRPFDGVHRKVEQADIRFDRKAGKLSVRRATEVVVELEIDERSIGQAETKYRSEANRYLVDALFFTCRDADKTVSHVSTLMLREGTNLFFKSPPENCLVGGLGASSCESGGGRLKNGIICSPGYWACCGDSNRINRCIPAR